MEIQEKKILLYTELQDYVRAHFPMEDFFCCVYGSYPSRQQTSKSDIDLFIAAKDPSIINFEDLKSFIIALHAKHGLAQDEEVPYENKLLVSFDDVENAVKLKAFTTSGGGYVIPPIEKTTAFLGSQAVRERLLFNALTSPHDCIAGNATKYTNYKDTAENNLYQLSLFLAKQKGEIKDRGSLLSVLLENEQGEEGELYLGYKKREVVLQYLSFILSKYYV